MLNFGHSRRICDKSLQERLSMGWFRNADANYSLSTSSELLPYYIWLTHNNQTMQPGYCGQTLMWPTMILKLKLLLPLFEFQKSHSKCQHQRFASPQCHRCVIQFSASCCSRISVSCVAASEGRRVKFTMEATSNADVLERQQSMDDQLLSWTMLSGVREQIFRRRRIGQQPALTSQSPGGSIEPITH